jgi:predicted regulator of Ras-like GTPase activity (Roadblock/LC7/MglB family)
VDRQKRLEDALAEVNSHEGVLGAAIVSRDGLCVKSAGQLNLDRETFSAMSATVMGAAEIALGDVQGGRARSVVATTESAKMVVVGATRELLLIAYARADAPDAGLLRRMEHAAANVAAAVAGG